MAKILFISAHAPTDLYPQAGQKIALKNFKHYITEGSFIDVVVTANREELQSARDLITLAATNSINLHLYPLSKLNKLWNCITHPQTPLKFANRLQQSAIAKIQQLLIENTYDVVHFEYIHAASYLNVVKQHIDPNRTKTLISIHDVEFQKYLRKAQRNFLHAIESVRVFSYEQILYAGVDNLWILSEKDRNFVTSLYAVSVSKVLLKYPQPNNFVYQVQRSPSTVEPKSLLFWAAMNRAENEQAILTFIKHCFNQLLEFDPAFKLYIVGAAPSKKVQNLASNQIIVTGFVESPIPFFERAEVGIVPLLEGAGIKLKTLEMLEAGLPVISTTVGAEGVVPKDKPLLVSDDFNKWLHHLKTTYANSIF